MIALPADDIIHLIPQKPPFVMVSRLLDIGENSTRSSFVVEKDNIFVKNNLFQEAGLMENIAQTVALRGGYIAEAEDKPAPVGYIVAVNNLHIGKLPAVGDELVTEIVVATTIMDITVISGKVWHNNEFIAGCEMKIFAGAK